MESLRAPNICTESLRNPSYRDKQKRKLGRTKEEREAKLKEKEEYRQRAIKLYEDEGKL